MPSTIGRNSTVSTGSTRDEAPIRPAGDHAPGAARELVHHAERQAAERGAEHQQIARQVRLEELRGIEEQSDERHHGAGGAGQEELALVARELGDLLVGGLPDERPCPTRPLFETRAARPPAHRPSLADTLSCSARM